jgi:hypothetical protein
MKKIVLYFLLLSFAFQSLSHLWIVASFYIHRDYIANNLCENRMDFNSQCKGQCQLMKKIRENEKKQEHKLPNLKHKEILLFFVSFPQLKTNFYSIPFKPKTPDLMHDLALSGFIFSVFHPPKTV